MGEWMVSSGLSTFHSKNERTGSSPSGRPPQDKSKRLLNVKILLFVNVSKINPKKFQKNEGESWRNATLEAKHAKG